LSIPALLAARKYAAAEDKAFLTKLLLIAMAARLAFGAYG
jgi:hypothetical protein